MNDQLFLNTSLQKQLEQNGWVSFPYLQNHEVSTLKEFYIQNTLSNNFSGFHATMFYKDDAYKQAVDHIIKKVINIAFNSFFNPNYKQLYANFVVKENGEESEMKWHQDWANVHENDYNSYAIWIPLIDINDMNGAFTVAEGSHKLKNHVRGPGVENEFFTKNWVEEHYKIKALYLKAGEAVVWHHRLLHASPPNFTNLARIAVTSILTPKEAENIYFYKQKNEKFIREYHVNEAFYTKNRIDALPKASLNRKFFYDFDYSTNEQNMESFKFLTRVKRLFNFY